ncbi:MAG TPA: cytochrome d ubiquinol oxidase subunit II [Chitinophagaceae bacterium]|jgi:hypothetical protein|nr:cytochrome d ubiquinol oxidase subunit II [Chitinophagaceae bacterium]
MNRGLFIGLLAVLSGISGYLLSKASGIGRLGINLFYKEYRFLKVWWQGGAVVFGTLLLLFFLQGWAARRLAPGKARLVHLLCILAALAGLYFTYNDFRHTLSHRLLGERFHLGAYLFWAGWILVSLFYLALRPRRTVPVAGMPAVPRS